MAGHDVHSFPKPWKGTKNGNLLKLIADNGFECLLTTDQNMVHQQNLERITFAIVVLSSQELEDLIANIETIGQTLAIAGNGGVFAVSISASPQSRT